MNQPNFLYHEFSCGCKTNDHDCRMNKRTSLFCPIHHKAYRIATWFTCMECGRATPTMANHMTACPNCLKEYRKRIAKVKRDAKPKKKKIPFDQSKRVYCQHAKLCVDKQVYTGKRFNCHNCELFKEI